MNIILRQRKLKKKKKFEYWGFLMPKGQKLFMASTKKMSIEKPTLGKIILF